MTSSVFTQVYAEDWGMFLLSYGQAICFWALGTMALALIVKTVRHKYTLSASSGIYLMLTVGSVISFMVYGIMTAKWKLCMSLLDSENDAAAEFAYTSLFQSDLKETILLATNSNQPANIRFYAACRTADLLAKNDEKVRAKVLNSMDFAPPVVPSFFGTNSLTYGFILPGYSEGPFAVNYIIETRLARLGKSSQ